MLAFPASALDAAGRAVFAENSQLSLIYPRAPGDHGIGIARLTIGGSALTEVLQVVGFL